MKSTANQAAEPAQQDLEPIMTEDFTRRHIGPDSEETQQMLNALSVDTLERVIGKAAPESILQKSPLEVGKSMSEPAILARARELADKNKVFHSFLGQGYYGTYTPGVILRNILENPSWYTAYTPYQAEISQGRMEALLNFQSLVVDLTGMQIANASLLDEGTAAAEAMSMSVAISKKKAAKKFFVANNTFAQTKEVLKTRALPLDIELVFGDEETFEFDDDFFGALTQYPGADGKISKVENFCERIKSVGGVAIVAADLLSLTLLKAPGELGADICVGTAQRFGVPFGFGGPHAGYLSTKDANKRLIPGRIIGVSKDSFGDPALRLSLQTREQHIRREKATSNICTAQVLLAVISSMYAVYHGPKGLREIAARTHGWAKQFLKVLKAESIEVRHEEVFDTVVFKTSKLNEIFTRAEKNQLNLFRFAEDEISVSFDETTTPESFGKLVEAVTGKASFDLEQFSSSDLAIASSDLRTSEYLTSAVFNKHHSETEMLRYIKSLEKKDLTLADAMIPLGSCTMKLNATAEMLPITWPEFANIHPFAPVDQAQGYLELIKELGDWLCDITGFADISFQPNAGSQGEYAGLLVIRKYHEERGEGHRKICLIPSSAHGTNPASAIMAGFKVVVVKCDDQGNVDLADLDAKTKEHSENLAALMVTYPSTHGVFEEEIRTICEMIHEHGGQVYMDGANLNALVGISRPGEFGADVSHLNLHKTFCIPHGGGGPGVGPIGVAKHLAPFLPKHEMSVEAGPKSGISAVSSAPWGSAGILPISWAYIAMMGSEGLKKATQIAILNANYLAKKLEDHFPVLYKNAEGWIAHECIIDVRPLKDSAGVTVDDIAKRLMDFGFHAPTMSWPVAGTLMIEPTESESKEELDRFVEAMIQIRKEAADIESGKFEQGNNPLSNAPHSLKRMTSDDWDLPYSRQQAAYALPWLYNKKFWVPVGRVDNAFGDRNLVCTCAPLEDYQ
ncbi:MAG: aminomethyl-transferring glycine dehydrogenase [Bdellovibrionales bacterium]|nr:aminomethyl-transferring glycine dehydrogenase [Bdellovibrionales bacterium]